MSDKPIRLYRPSNGTEGAWFWEAWCCRCQRDKAMREGADFDECDDNERCDIIANTMAFGIDEPSYPQEWRYDENGTPCCTAFVPAGDRVPERDEHTLPLF